MKGEQGDSAYRTDLAAIHDSGFGHFARGAAPVIIDLLRDSGIREGLIVDLGCGSGIMAGELCRAGYDVLGFDISAAMVELARQRVPRAAFRNESFLDAQLPSAVAITAVGEIFNYLFDRRNSPAQLKKTFKRIHQALVPGGLFLFDVALVGREPTGRRRAYSEGDDWACLFEAVEDGNKKSLTRTITTFHRQGDLYRRGAEVHQLRLYERGELLEPLRALGFRVRTLKHYGDLDFPPGYLSFVATKRG